MLAVCREIVDTWVSLVLDQLIVTGGKAHDIIAAYRRLRVAKVKRLETISQLRHFARPFAKIRLQPIFGGWNAWLWGRNLS